MPAPLRFRRHGRTWLPVVTDGHDLVGVLDLDDALWTATAAPIATLRGDPAFLASLDLAGDGRIRAGDVRSAIRWLLARLADAGSVGPLPLHPDLISVDFPGIRAAARWVMDDHASEAAEGITVAAVRRARLSLEGVEPEPIPRADLAALERLLLYQTWLLPFVDSFVTCRGLYQPDTQALFEWGTLVLDGRWFKLAVRVPDAERHESFTRRGALCVMYVEVGQGEHDWEYEVVVPITAGTLGFVREGMWGVFFEHTGRERHARVRRLVIHPISLGDALLRPFRTLAELVRSLEGRVSAVRRAVGTNTALTMARSGFSTASVAAGAAVPVATAPTSAGLLALAAGTGIAIAAVGSAFTYVSDRFVAASGGLAGWLVSLRMVRALPDMSERSAVVAAYPLAVVLVLGTILLVVALLYILPVSIGAWLSLRRRDLGLLLIGSGWSINSRMFLTRRLARVYTQTPAIPRALRDR